MVFRKPPEETPESVETMGTAAGETAVQPGESRPASAGGWLGGTEEPEPEDTVSPVTIQNFLLVSLLAAAALVALMMVIQIIRSAGRYKKRHRRKR